MCFFSARSLAGDLFVALHVDEKQGIHRDGLNLFSKISVDYTEAILGTSMEVGYRWSRKRLTYILLDYTILCLFSVMNILTSHLHS